ncbi:cbb3-type cytochrome c oxidase subunit I [Rhizobium sp. C4]|uniref:cbb3-type cytochrome c oxidase subunit I n=1 Tax=Rhizobium sp. C4 TaxID=1349800 RepID=UPI001E5AF581|nr:cbb3-type cytochrome c oxidase subunit I [Rhizobium sp. C4]MCD2173217.1 cbb3-type cytochrome c oxidase subunit I [Rhizobium sp. C4]
MAAPVGGRGAANAPKLKPMDTSMRTLSYFCFVSAALYALIGMAMGIFMAASHDHTLSPAHAHLNLLGWVSMGIFGLFYQAAPGAASRRIAKYHVAFATLSVWLLIPGVAMANLGMNEGLAVIGSLMTIASMALFFFIAISTPRIANA